MRTHEHSSLIDMLGGNAKVAAACHVTSQAVSRWRVGGIPPARLMYMQAVFADVCRAWAQSTQSQAPQQPAEAQP